MHSVSRRSQLNDWLLPRGTLFFSCGILLGRSLNSLIPALAGLALCFISALLWRGGRRFALLTALCLIGAAAGFSAYHPTLPAEGDYLVEGTVIQAIAVDDKGQAQTVLSGVTLDGQSQPNAYWTYYLPEDEAPPEWLMPGARVSFSADVYHPSGASNPGGFNFQDYLLQRGIRFGVYGATELHPAEPQFSLQGWVAGIRHTLTRRLMSVMGDEAGAYAAAMLLGTKDFIPQDDRAAFQTLGIAHILSVSGFHVGVLVALLRLLLRPWPLPRMAQIGFAGTILAAYCLLTGGSAPVVRAAGLLLIREYARTRQRQILPLHLLCATALMQLAFNPTLLTGPSFQLSYGAMLGLTVAYPPLRNLRACKTRTGQWLWEALCLSLAAQLGILAPQLYWFGELPLLGIFLNIAVTGLSGGLITLYWITLAALPIPGLAEAAGALSALATDWLLIAVRWFASLDAITLWTRRADLLTWLGWALLLIFCIGCLPRPWARHRRRMLLLGGLLAALILIPLPERSVTYTQLSVGNADAAILQDRDMTVVIDTGEDGQALASYLHQRRQSVEALVLTHLHTDHAGGVAALISEDVPVQVCYLPLDAHLPHIDEEVLPLLDALAATGTEFRVLSRGDVIPLPSGSLTALWPIAEHASPLHDANDMSLVLQADVSGVTLLLTGDLSGVYERYAALPADVLKVAHHGSASSTSAEFLAAVDPQLLLLSNKSESRALRTRELAGEIPLYDTDQQGAITLQFLGDGAFEVSSYLK